MGTDKVCRDCEKSFPRTTEYFYYNRLGRSWSSRCRSCFRNYHGERYRAGISRGEFSYEKESPDAKQRRRERALRWRAENATYVRAYNHDRYLQWKAEHPEQYEAMKAQKREQYRQRTKQESLT